MKNIVYTILAAVIFLLPSCKDPNSIFDEYIIPNGRSYPGMAIDAVAFPGKERVELSWKKGTDPKVVKARIFWNNGTDSVEVAVSKNADILSRIISPLSENTHSFFIRTYDDEGNVSVPVEVIGTVYGDIYQSSLFNRMIKSALCDSEDILQIEWNSADVTETGIYLNYTSINGDSKTLPIPNTETSTTIADLKVGSEILYQTAFKPDSQAIDEFYAPKVALAYWGNVTSSAMINTKKPFERDLSNPPPWDGSGRYFSAVGWKSNAEGGKHGIICSSDPVDVLGMVAWAGYTPSDAITNGKIYQTVELKAGTYQFIAYTGMVSGANAITSSYIAVNLGNDLRDIENTIESLSYVEISKTNIGETSSSKPRYILEFVLTEDRTVSMGFVATTNGGNVRIYFEKFELLKKL